MKDPGELLSINADQAELDGHIHISSGNLKLRSRARESRPTWSGVANGVKMSH